MNVYLHICCSICTLKTFRHLRDRGHAVRGYFFNPNIHPLIEFRRRKKSVRVLQEQLPLPVEYEEEYGLKLFLREITAWSGRQRCLDCYALRLDRTARAAADEGADAFTTTLLTSPHQDSEGLERIGAECGRRHGVEFISPDWDELSEESCDEASDRGLYRQQYCGCIFSEEERYEGTTRHLYKGGGPRCGDARWSDKNT